MKQILLYLFTLGVLASNLYADTTAVTSDTVKLHNFIGLAYKYTYDNEKYIIPVNEVFYVDLNPSLGHLVQKNGNDLAKKEWATARATRIAFVPVYVVGCITAALLINEGMKWERDKLVFAGLTTFGITLSTGFTLGLFSNHALKKSVKELNSSIRLKVTQSKGE